MKKSKKLRNKKLKKGGKSFIEQRLGLDANTSGPFIADDISMNVRLNNKLGLLNEYEKRKIDAEKHYQEVEKKYNENHKQKIEEDTLNFKFKKERNLQWDRFTNNSIKTVKLIGNGFTALIKALGAVGKYIVNSFGNIFSKFGSFSSSVFKAPALNTIFKVLILIAVVLVIIFSSLGFFSSNSSNPAASVDTNKLINQSYEMANTNNFFIKTPEPPTILGMMAISFQNLVPEKYRVQFTAFKNNVNKAFGNDLTENSMYNLNREEIKTGRTDDIFHINLDNNNEKVYTMVKPKDIEIPIKYDNMSKKADLNQLPELIKEKYTDTILKLRLNGTTNEKGLFVFPTENITYIDSNNSNYKLNQYGINNPFYNDIYSSNFILNDFNMKNKIDIFNKNGSNMMIYDSDIGKFKYPEFKD